MLSSLPDAFAVRIERIYGPAGRAWLAGLPDLIAHYARLWSLRELTPYEPSYNYIVGAETVSGARVVLKLAFPNPEFTTEVAALALYAGSGAARLLEAEPDAGALLIERVVPGTPLLSVADDEQATLICAHSMQRLWRPLPASHPFPTLHRWSRSLHDRAEGRVASALPPDLLRHAWRTFHDLIDSSAPPVLLHGDLHYWNLLLSGSEEWLAIDPKGVAGEPVYDTGAWLRNPIPEIRSLPDLDQVLGRRVRQFAEILGFDRQRIAAWGFAQEVLSACWSEEDDEARLGRLPIAEALERLAGA
jgi:streptomycin 6-kinase